MPARSDATGGHFAEDSMRGRVARGKPRERQGGVELNTRTLMRRTITCTSQLLQTTDTVPTLGLPHGADESQRSGFARLQRSRTHVNFQRVPTVDTSNPFVAKDIPSADESMVVIRFANPKGIDFRT